MKKSVLYKVATVMAVLALGGVSITHDALAKGGGGGGGGGGHFGGRGGHFGDGGHFAGGDFHGDRGDRFVTPFFASLAWTRKFFCINAF